MSLVAAIEGVLVSRGADFALVRIGGGVTLKVSVPASDLASMRADESRVHLHTHLVVREDDLQLYGFATAPGLQLFEALLQVNGVGPRVALAVLSALSPADAAAAIVAGDTRALTRAHGVGKRTAERIVLELKGKLEESAGIPATVLAATSNDAGDPALQWLLGLGFSAAEARQALAVESAEGLPVEERVRRALRRLGAPR
ncbi:MAG: Holliday junction branch migration protein RuvA [SAR202 cluster bacterium]|nr:Holliday junction branch migration protein RuvA [SAR202 cluster bacterium]